MASPKEADTLSFKSIVYFVLAAFFPLWPISLPIFGWLGYKNYRSGIRYISMYELEKAKALMDSGTITSIEFEAMKSRLRPM
jgi:hypothetical protein